MSRPIAEIIEAARRKKKLNQEELAAQVGCNAAWISKIERRGKRPGAALLRRICEVLNLDPKAPEKNLALLTLSGKNFTAETISSRLSIHNHDTPQPLLTRPLPLYGRIVAGAPSSTPIEAAGEVQVLAHLWGESRYVLRVQGDSMFPTIQTGDLVLVDNALAEHSDWKALDSKVVAVLLNGESTLKRLFSERRRGHPDRVHLKSDNPMYPAITLDDADELIVQGIVIALVHRDL